MKSHSFEWAVVGAGPAGIAAIGQLLDQGIPGERIAWCDPYFQVGDLGRLWHAVHSNTRVKLFLDFLNACKAFEYQKKPQAFSIDTLPEEHTCQLADIAEPLQWITHNLQERVTSYRKKVTQLKLFKRKWHLTVGDDTLQANKVILAIGAEPKTLDHNLENLTSISLETALNPEKLKKECTEQDTVAVFGSSHSAMIIIRSLLEMNVKRVINFYLSPIRFAVAQDEWILFDNTGLKGTTADWVREFICGEQPAPLSRVIASPDQIKTTLPLCNKVIDAVGFKRRSIETTGMNDLTYNPTNGIIAPGLFGFGVAFPARVKDPFGNEELDVGLWKFMKYLKRILPIWENYHA